jgi:hypothetical protein
MVDQKVMANYHKNKLPWLLKNYENPITSVDRKGTKEEEHYHFRHRCGNFISTSQIDTIISLFDRSAAGEGLFQRFDFVLNTEIFDSEDDDEIYTQRIDKEQRMICETGHAVSKYLVHVDKEHPVTMSFKPDSPELKRWYEWRKEMIKKGKENGAELYKKYIRAMVYRTMSQTKKVALIVETMSLIADGDPVEGSEDGFPNKFVRIESLERAIKWGDERYRTSLRIFFMLESGPVQKEKSLMTELLQRKALRPLKIKGLGTIIRRSDALKHSHLTPVSKFNEMIKRFKESGQLFEFKLTDPKTKRETVYLATFKEPTDKKIIDLIVEHFRG